MSNRNAELFSACEAGDIDAVQRNISAGKHDVDGTSRWGHIDPQGWQRSPLHVAIQFGHLRLAQWLLENGADANSQTKYGDTPLNAVMAPPLASHWLEAVQLLMEHGADPSLPNEEDETPLRHAQRTQAIWSAVGLLLTHSRSSRAPVDPAGRFAIVQVAQGGRDVYYVTVASPEQLPENGLPGDTIVGALSEPPESFSAIDSATFAPNAHFVKLLHDVTARRGPDQPGLQREAQRIGKGHVFVIDQRTPTPGGPVPPEDVLGYFAVAEGAVVPGSYRANPNYRLLTEHGLFRLPPELHAALVAELISRS